MKKEKGDIGGKEKSDLPHTLNLFAPPRKIYTPNDRSNAIENTLTLIQKGYTLPEVAKKAGIDEDVLIHWMNKDTYGARTLYAHAREVRADRIAREIMEIADRTDAKNPAEVNKARLQTDVRRWYLSHILPEKYGDLQRLEVTGKNGGAIGIQAIGAVAIADAQRLRSLIFGQSDATEACADEIPQEG